MLNVSTFRYSGLVHTKSIGIEPSVDKKGVIFVYKKNKMIVSNNYSRSSTCFLITNCNVSYRTNQLIQLEESPSKPDKNVP